MGEKIAAETLELPKEGALNCHSSFLPDSKGKSIYRVLWAHAEEHGGATIHHMTEEFDDGDIIAAQRFEIGLFDIMTRYTELTAGIREAILLTELGYDGKKHDGGRYYSPISWKKTVGYGIVNHLLRAVGSDRRIEIPPKNAPS